MTYLLLHLAVTLAEPQGLIAERLPELAEQQGLKPDDFRGFDANTTVSLTVAGSPTVVVVQAARSDKNTAQIVLTDRRGKILDRLRCITFKGRLEVQVHATPEQDGTYVAFHFVETGENYGYQVHYHGKVYSFSAVRMAGASNLWKKTGVCRLGIVDNHFVVLYPELLPNLKAATQLRLSYRLDGQERGLSVEDVPTVLSALEITRRFDMPLRDPSRLPKVTFIMPDASLVFTFVTPTQIGNEEWGYFNLESQDFYEILSSRVHRAEKQVFELIPSKP